METPLLIDILLIFSISIIVILLSHHIHLPEIVGFLLTGTIVGPYGFRLIKAVHEVEILAEIGVILLLFTLGIEFSLKRLFTIKKEMLVGGSLQVIITIIVASIICRIIMPSFNTSIFAGFLISLSSTVIVLKLLQEKVEIDSPHGRTALAILIFQDLIIVPMMLLTPILSGSVTYSENSLLILLLKGIGILAFVFICSKWIINKVLFQILRTRSRELFLLNTLLICFAIVWLFSSAGLSLALGAFLAGLIISESDYSHEALANILPFRTVFMSFFFVSIGMLFDVSFLFSQPIIIVLCAIGIIVFKMIIAAAITIILGFPLRTAILVGLLLSQVGEFSFILSKTGIEYDLLRLSQYQFFLAVSLCTMAFAPFLISRATQIADLILRLPLPKTMKTSLNPISKLNKTEQHDHIIVIGYGVNGRNVVKAARVARIPYIIIDMNPETIKKEQIQGELIHYGDASNDLVLEHADIKNARVVVIAISDPAATRRITQIARNLNPKIYIIVRTRYLQEMSPLYEAGADDVITEEFETSIEIFTRVLMKYLVSKDKIETFITEIRSDRYGMFRNISKAKTTLIDLQLTDNEISSLRLRAKSSIVGKILAQFELRKKYGVN